MSKRKGLSFDEKKAVLLGAMQSEAAFYTLKELETLGKSKGVIPQAVKDVVEGLTADGEVQTDKVGSQVLFWSLPSQKSSTLRAKRRKVSEDIERLQKEYETLQAELATVSVEPAPTEQEVAALRKKVVEDKKRRDEMKRKVETMERCGPGKIAEMKKQIAVAKEAANRWADNIINIRSMFMRENRGEVTTAQFNRMFNLPEEFADID
mmetsp:Transcript_125937/g.364367  ORF Transcript_125937/g.364367 Transcript_125937/m.364367 type:complete len:208 (-) Transcript_125937:170-793(-)